MRKGSGHMAVNKAEGAVPGLDGGTHCHIPVLLDEVISALSPLDGETFLDGTFGAGGYSRAILSTADCSVIGLDQDPSAIAGGRALVREAGGRLRLVEGRFSQMVRHCKDLDVAALDGVVLDIGVSSMQLDRAARGFSFQHNGPLDMRMSQSGPTAADLVNGLDEKEIATVLWRFGEERKSRRIARAIVERRVTRPFKETLDLAGVIETILPRRGGDKIHPATRTFQALRIYLNDELGELLTGLNGATSLLRPGGRLVVVCFHSLEDRIVKRFLRLASGRVSNQSRHLPDVNKEEPPHYEIINPKAVKAKEREINANPRARSALLRAARRTDAAAHSFDEAALGLEPLQL